MVKADSGAAMTEALRTTLQEVVQKWRDETSNLRQRAEGLESRSARSYSEGFATAIETCADDLDAALAAVAGGGRREPHEGDCNPFVSSCGAKFCTAEALAEHENACTELEALAAAEGRDPLSLRDDDDYYALARQKLAGGDTPQEPPRNASERFIAFMWEQIEKFKERQFATNDSEPSGLLPISVIAPYLRIFESEAREASK